MRLLILHTEKREILAIPFDKVEMIQSHLGSENMPCQINGYFVKESFNDIVRMLSESN